MNSDQIIRNIKIHNLIGIEIKEQYLSIYSDLKDMFSDLNTYESEEYPEDIFYGKSKEELYIKYYSISKHISLDYDNVWSKLESKHDLSYEQIQGLTTWYLGEVFQMEGFTSRRIKRDRNCRGWEYIMYVGEFEQTIN